MDTSIEAYLPAKLSLMGLYARSLYHTLFGKDDELKLLSLFNGPAASSPTELITAQAPTINAWSIDRTWRAVQRQWGFDPGPDPIVAPPQGLQPGAGGARDAGAQAQTQLRNVQGKMEEVVRRFDDERQDQWTGQGGKEGEDEFNLEDEEADFGGTVAIVMLCIFLGWVGLPVGSRSGPISWVLTGPVLCLQRAVPDAPECDACPKPASPPGGRACRSWRGATSARSGGGADARAGGQGGSRSGGERGRGRPRRRRHRDGG